MTTVNSDMVIYNQLAQTAYLERLQDNLDVFNKASNGAIRYVNEVIQGDFSQKSFYRVGGGIEHRDVNSVAKVTPKKIGAGEMVGVKTPYKYGPYSSTEEAFKRRARSPEEFAEGHVPGAVNIDVKNPNFEEEIQKLDTKKNYFIYCKSGVRAKLATEKMQEKGFKNAKNFKDGMSTYKGTVAK